MARRTLLIAGVAAAALLLILLPLALRRGSAERLHLPRDAATPGVVTQEVVLTSGESQTLRWRGFARSGSEADIAAMVGGEVAAVPVREGDTVRRGQLLVLLDDRALRLEVQRAGSAVDAARSAWKQALTGVSLKREEIEQRIRHAQDGVTQAQIAVDRAQAGVSRRSETSAAEVRRAEAALEAARAALTRTRSAGRPEERSLLELQLRQARRAEKLAEKQLSELELLLKRGGVPRIEVEAAREERDGAADQVQAAAARLAIFDRGADRHDVAGAEAQVRGAEAALAAARSGADTSRLDQAEMDAARAALKGAEADLAAARRGRDEITLAQQQAEVARAEHDRAAGALRAAEERLADARVTSPVRGVVSRVRVRPGETAAQGQPLVTVTGSSGVYVEVAASLADARFVTPGLRVVVETEEATGSGLPGRVRAAGARTASDSRSVPVLIDVDAPPGALRPGQAVAVRATVQGRQAGISLPPAALRTAGRDTAVWLVRHGLIEEARVEVLERAGGRIIVAGSLAGGDRVVVAAPPGVQVGDRVDSR